MAERTRPATCRPLGDGRIGIWVAYEDRFEAKALPSSRWDPSLKCWWVTDLFAADARALVERLNRRHTGEGGDHHQLVEAFAAMFAALPADMRTPVHRALTRTLHPDTGGTEAAMKALNAAWETLA